MPPGIIAEAEGLVLGEGSSFALACSSGWHSGRPFWPRPTASRQPLHGWSFGGLSASTAQLRRFSATRGDPDPVEETWHAGQSQPPISSKMRSRLRKLGLHNLSEVQREVCRPILDGRDVFGVSQAGRGRCLAFLVPLLERLEKERWSPDDPIIVLQPTRDLAEQTYLAANRLREPTTKVALVYAEGGSQALEAQRALLRRGANLIVGTPKRIREMVEAGTIQRDQVRVLVLDEAEELLSVGMARDVRGILDALAQASHSASSRRQTLVFAGASPQWLQEDLAPHLRNPLLVDLIGSRPAMPAHAQHWSCEVPGGATRRARVVAWLLETYLGSEEDTLQTEEQQLMASQKKAIIFAPTRAEVALLGSHAMMRHRVLGLHGQMSQEERQETLSFFRCMPGQVLVTTDLAVRGLELPEVPLVIHVSSPPSLEAYAHRVSRLTSETQTQKSKAVPRGRRQSRDMVADATPCEDERSASERGPLARSVVIYAAHQATKLRDLERELGAGRFLPMVPPDEAALRSTAVSYISRELKLAVTQYDSEAFEDDARQQLELHGTRLLAAALVLLERRRRGEDWVSPLSGRSRYTTLLFCDPHLQLLRSRQAVVAAIGRVLRKASGRHSNEDAAASADTSEAGSGRRAPRGKSGSQSQSDDQFQIGRVELTPRGWIADIPQGHVSTLLEDKGLKERGIVVQPVAQIPEVIDADSKGRGGPRTVSRKSGRQRRRAPLDTVKKKNHLEFLYPAGRRELFGNFLAAGQEKKEAAQPTRKTKGKR
ncbi:unnamed protein product [Polarella glacialis]|nr:unnamed protein product [Polarella glacialis]